MINNSYESSSSSSESSSLSNSPVPLANFTNYWQAYNLDSTQNKFESFSSYPYYNFPTASQQSTLQPTSKAVHLSPPLDNYNYTTKLANSYYYQNENDAVNVQQPLTFNYNLNSYHEPSYPTTNNSFTPSLHPESNKSILSSNKLPSPQTIHEKPRTPQVQTPTVKTGSVVNRRRNRTQFSNSQIESLEAVFEKTHYPEVQLVDRLSEKLNLSIERISIWFQNRRAKDKKAKKHGIKDKKELSQSSNRDLHMPTLSLP